MLVPLDGGLWEADARAELEDVAKEIDEKLAEVEEDVATLGGLAFVIAGRVPEPRSEEHTSELQSLMRISYAVFCLKKKTHHTITTAIERHVLKTLLYSSATLKNTQDNTR